MNERNKKVNPDKTDPDSVSGADQKQVAGEWDSVSRKTSPWDAFSRSAVAVSSEKKIKKDPLREAAEELEKEKAAQKIAELKEKQLREQIRAEIREEVMRDLEADLSFKAMIDKRRNEAEKKLETDIAEHKSNLDQQLAKSRDEVYLELAATRKTLQEDIDEEFRKKRLELEPAVRARLEEDLRLELKSAAQIKQGESAQERANRMRKRYLQKKEIVESKRLLETVKPKALITVIGAGTLASLVVMFKVATLDLGCLPQEPVSKPPTADDFPSEPISLPHAEPGAKPPEGVWGWDNYFTPEGVKKNPSP